MVLGSESEECWPPIPEVPNLHCWRESSYCFLVPFDSHCDVTSLNIILLASELEITVQRGRDWGFGRPRGVGGQGGGGEFGLGIKWMALLAEEQKCRPPARRFCYLSLPLNGSIIEGQWDRDSDLELSGVTSCALLNVHIGKERLADDRFRESQALLRIF